MEITCPYRSLNGEQPVCQIVAELTDRPLAESHTNDSACTFCLGCGIAPQAPNMVTASMSIGAAQRTGDPAFLAEILNRMRPHLTQVKREPAATVESVPCVIRGRVTRQQQCKPCQTSTGQLMVDVFDCHVHGECTLNNTGVHPRIHACITCQDRLEKSYQLSGQAIPPEVLAAIPSRPQHAQRKYPH